MRCRRKISSTETSICSRPALPLPCDHDAALHIAATRTAGIQHSPARVTEARHADDAPEQVMAGWESISDRRGETVPENGGAQGTLEVGKAMRALGGA